MRYPYKINFFDPVKFPAIMKQLEIQRGRKKFVMILLIMGKGRVLTFHHHFAKFLEYHDALTPIMTGTSILLISHYFPHDG